MTTRTTNDVRNLQQQEVSKVQKKAKEAELERWLAEEARSRERQARRDEKRRLGLDPNTSSTQTSSDEDEGGDEVDSGGAYEAFLTAVSAEWGEPDVVILNADEGCFSGATGGRVTYPLLSLPPRPPSPSAVRVEDSSVKEKVTDASAASDRPQPPSPRPSSPTPRSPRPTLTTAPLQPASSPLSTPGMVGAPSS